MLSFSRPASTPGINSAAGALRVMIAEMHFSGGTPLDKLSSTIKLPLKALEKAKAEMLMDIQATAIEKYREESDMEFPKGEA